MCQTLFRVFYIVSHLIITVLWVRDDDPPFIDGESVTEHFTQMLMRKSGFALPSLSKEHFFLVHCTWQLPARSRNSTVYWEHEGKTEAGLALSPGGKFMSQFGSRFMNEAAAWTGNSGKKDNWEKLNWSATPSRTFSLTSLILSTCGTYLRCRIGKHALFLFGSVPPFAGGPNVSHLHSG